MLIIEIFFLFSLSFVVSQRYYAFIETLFVIDRNYFPPLSSISYDDYIRTIVDTTNIVYKKKERTILSLFILL
jgi:hypothetical protein